MFCQNCGSPVQGNFCSNCGAKLNSNIPQNCQTEPVQNKPKFKVPIILIILLWASSSGQYLNNGFELSQANIYGLIDIAVASILMLCYPFTSRIINKEQIEYYECRKICIGNSVILLIISIILQLVLGAGFIGGLGAFMYYYINMHLFSAPKTEKTEENNKEPIDDYIYDPSLSDIENQKKRFAEMDIEALDYLIKNSKDVYTDETYNLALEYYNLRSSGLNQVSSVREKDTISVDDTNFDTQFQEINIDNYNTFQQSFFSKYKKEIGITLITIFITFICCFGVFYSIYVNKPNEKSTQSTTKTSTTLSKPNNNLPSLSNPSESLPSLPALYVGSKNSDKYHKPDCKWAKNIKVSNKITFTSSTNAKNKGYSPCKTCID